MRSLRAALARGDGPGVVGLLGGEVPKELLQLAGDGLLLALGQGVTGTAGLAGACAMALRERGWAGDEELATELGAATGDQQRAAKMKGVPVDLDELSRVLEAGPEDSGAAVDLVSGEVWPNQAIEEAQQAPTHPDFEDTDRWLYLRPEGSRERQLDMADFISTVRDHSHREELLLVLDEQDPFQHFKLAVSRWPEEGRRWDHFLEERYRGRARWWLAEVGYRAVPRALGPVE